MVKQLGQPPWIPQKEPSQHRLKSRGLPIGRGIGAARSPGGAVAATAHPIQLRFAKQGLQLLQYLYLGLGLNSRHYGTMHCGRPGRLTALAESLVQFPNRIPQPGKLDRSELASRLGSL
jgi:hypothetical protein